MVSIANFQLPEELTIWGEKGPKKVFKILSSFKF